MGSKGISDFLLERRNAIPIDRLIEVVPRIEVQHVCNGTVRIRPEHAAAPPDSRHVLEEPRMQPATDHTMSVDRKLPRYAGGERDGSDGLENVSLVPQYGLGREIGEAMEDRTPDEDRINLLRRQDTVETPLNAVKDSCPREAMERDAQRVRAFDMEQECKIVGMEEELLRHCEECNAFRRYVLGRCTYVYILE